jgi:putative membrane-bound dehydrogenase-like protein
MKRDAGNMNRLIVLSLSFCLASMALGETPALPTVNDPTLKIELFAQEPMLAQPIGMTFTQDGKLLVIQSNTHFRPKNYQGPEHDRVLWLCDTDGDGKADKSEVFFEGTDFTMDIATAPDGRIYLAARNEILRMTDNNGKADKIERKLLFLETDGRYPHNGLSGLAFDNKGGLYFGMGENLGAPYVLKGTDGSHYGDGGAEGGNVFHVDLDGGELHRVASGFWNPFGVCVDAQGNVFATDNDPDSRPPCRLHHIIEGGDYGYHFRYGRSGLHPFDAWNGELPGTLPMLAGTGEAPCDVIWYAPAATKDFRGLPPIWHGRLLVASWVDHSIESYELPDSTHAYDGAKKSFLVQGGTDFRPVAFAVAPDGSIFVSDWVKRDYELHGFGRVWRISAKEPREMNGRYTEVSGITWKQEQLAKILEAKKVTPLMAAEWLNDPIPWRFSAAITRISQEGDLIKILSSQHLPYPRQRAGLLLTVRAHSEAKSGAPLVSPAVFLKDNDVTVKLLATKWISDARLAEFKADVEALLKDTSTTSAMFYGGITALSRLDSAEVKEADLVKRLKASLAGADTTARIKQMALEILPDRDRNVLASELEPLLTDSDANIQEWAVHVLGTLRDQNKEPRLHKIAMDEASPPKVRAAAMMHLIAQPADVPALIKIAKSGDDLLQRAAFSALEGSGLSAAQTEDLATVGKPRGKISADRPPFADIAAWRQFLAKVPGKPDLTHGREVFLSPKLGACIICHRLDGIGAMAGPELTTIGSAKEPDYVLESILQPSRNVAPRFESYLLQTTDGQSRTVFQLMERGGNHTYVGLDGKPFEVKIEDIIKREALPVSIMPEGLVARLTDEEIRDLVAFLKSKK